MSCSLLAVLLLATPQTTRHPVQVDGPRQPAVHGARSPEAPASKPGGRARVVRVSEPLVFEGFVLEPSGAPAQGAVVVTSAGGKAVTDTLGRYRLETRVSRDAESVQVTAVSAAGKDRVASTRVELPAASDPTRVAPLLLTEGATCAPSWLPTFGALPGTDRTVYALAVYDDGGGPALYAAGDFTLVEGVEVNRIAKWDGASWSPLRNGLSSTGRALAVWDDGGGAALYVGGDFTTAGVLTTNGVAKWDGSRWWRVGIGTSNDVHALAVYDDGGGAALYAGGNFGTAGSAVARGIAKWDGSSWSALGSGMDSPVHVLTVYDDGGGAALHAAGEFRTAGGVAADRIAKWDGSSWSPLGSGMDFAIHALAVHDDGRGEGLYAGGEFTTAGGVAARRVARWDGSSWSPVGGVNDDVRALAVYDDGGGAALYAGGQFTRAGGVPANRIAKWDGSSWTALGSGVSLLASGVHALAVYDVGEGAVLAAGGDFPTAGGALANGIAKWGGAGWRSVASALNLNGHVRALTVYDDGGGSALYAGGDFTAAGGVATRRIGKWDGSRWSTLGNGIGGIVHALAVYDDGGGAALYAGGQFKAAGGTARRIAKWDGSSWSALGSGVSGAERKVRALTVYDDGTGEALYAGGSFNDAGGVKVQSIAKWDGSSWSSIGRMNDEVWALTVYDDGGGAALYAGGRFWAAGGIAANGIAKWDGSRWSALGSGISGGAGIVHALAVYDDGGGEALYVGGGFTSAGGIAASRIAKWDGSSWSAMGGRNSAVHALAVYDDGTGATLYAGGLFQRGIARWNGSFWSALGSGMDGNVSALTVFNDGVRVSLYAGGEFTRAFDSGDAYLAKWGCPAPPTGGLGRSDAPLPPPGAGGVRK